MHILPVNLASTCVISSSLSSNLSHEKVMSTVNILSSSAITLNMTSYSIELWITSKIWLVGIFVLSLFSISIVILYRLKTGTSVVDVVHAAIKAQTPKRKAIGDGEATSTLTQTKIKFDAQQLKDELTRSQEHWEQHTIQLVSIVLKSFIGIFLLF